MMTTFKECQQAEVCGRTHIKWESEEQRRMVFECRARAERDRRETAERRARFAATGVWR